MYPIAPDVCDASWLAAATFSTVAALYDIEALGGLPW